MTDNEIVKALECCSLIQGECKECPCDSVMDCDCEEMLLREAFYLINRKDAEIERLQEVTTNTVNSSIRFGLDKEQEIRKAKSEAYKEFAERLHQKCKKYPYTLPSVFTNIEITYKELTQNLHETCTEGGNEDGTNHS